LVHWNHARNKTHTKTSTDTTEDEKRSIGGSRLHSNADGEDNTGYHNAKPSSDAIGDRSSSERAEECPEGEN